MKRISQVLLAVIVAAMMVVTAAPILAPGPVASAEADGSPTEVPPLTITDLGDGRYEISNPYLEDYFGITPSGITDMQDPLSSGLYDIRPMEVGMVVPGNPTTSMGWDPADDVYGEMGKPGTHFASTMQHYAFFPAALDAGYDETANEHVGSPGVDWVCQLEYSGSELRLNFAKPDSTYYNAYIYTFDDVHTMGFYPWDQDVISSIQSRNILNYVVGDFDGDDNEEIAIHNGYDVLIVGIRDQYIYCETEAQYTLDKFEGSENTLYTPVSMAASDLDHDGVDELLVARSYYDAGIAGNNERTILYSIDVQDDTMSSVRLGYTDVDGSPLDMIMVSVTGADLDGDGWDEVVLGGYLWDNNNTDTYHTENWNYRAGELFLAYVEADHLLAGDPDYHLTVLGDDNGTAENMFQFSSHYALNDHNEVDTSIYTTDNSDNPTGLCRSPTWSNWTIPLKEVRMEGLNNGLQEQVYFNSWFYELDGGEFVVYQKTEPLERTPDGNNTMCNILSSGYVWDNTPEAYDGSETFFLSYASDLESHFDDGRTEWSFVLYDGTDSDFAAASYGEDMFADGRQITEWGLLSNYPTYMLLDTDHDAFFANLVGQMYSYTDPTVVAVVSAIPYDQDLADILISGPDSIGSTEFERYMESGTGEEVSTTFTVGPTGSLEWRFFEMSGEFGDSSGTVDSHTQTIEFSTAYESAEDAIAMYVIPVEFFVYTVYEPGEDGAFRTTLQAITYYHEAVNVMVGYESYVEFMEGYNEMMSECLEGFEEVPIIEPFDHVQGDVSSFDERLVDALASVNVTYYGSGTHASVSQGVELSQESEHSVLDGVQMNFDAQINFTHWLGIGVGAELESETCTTTSDASGLAFTSTMSNGMEPLYIGDPDDAHDVLSQYRMEGSMWAEVRSSTYADGSPMDYVYVGYTVSSYSSAPAIGSLSPDVYVPDGTDEDDPYNPTDDAVYLLATIPDVGPRDDLLADEYVLQIQWQGRWYDVNSTTLGVESYVQSGDSWIKSDAVAPGQTTANGCWFMVSGLSGLGGGTADFRLVAVADGDINPSMPVTAYLDLRTVADEVRTVSAVDIRDGAVILDRLSLVGEGTIALLIDVGEGSDSPLDLLMEGEGGELITLGERLPLLHGGYILYLAEGMDGGETDDESDGTSPLPFVVLAVAIAMVVTGLVARTDD